MTKEAIEYKLNAMLLQHIEDKWFFPGKLDPVITLKKNWIYEKEPCWFIQMGVHIYRPEDGIMLIQGMIQNRINKVKCV